MSTPNEIEQFLRRAQWLQTIESSRERYEAWARTGGATPVRFTILPSQNRPAHGIGHVLYNWFTRVRGGVENPR